MKNDYKLTRLYVYLTGSCNLKCRHCWIDPSFSKTAAEDGIKLPQWEKILKDSKALGLKFVKLTGGEPLLYHDFPGLIRLIYSMELDYSIETNAVLIDGSAADLMKDTGIFLASVSLDGSTPESYALMRGDRSSFHKAVSGIKKLVDRGINVQIIFTMCRINHKDITGVMALARDLGVRSLKINPLMDIGRAKNLKEEEGPLEIREILQLSKIVEESSAKGSLYVDYDIPVAFKTVEFVKYLKHICGIKNNLGILPDGSVALCPIGINYKNLILGNLYNDSIKDIWEKSPVLLELRDQLPRSIKGICSRCIYNLLCLGKCRIESFINSGDIYMPYFFCQKAYEEGLFPEELLL